ncbi:MAG: hypothetical protein M0T84_06670 [Betaproteobacteria bacterium]|nr:hypothetical protein [Betaproteobacteria bacterium]
MSYIDRARMTEMDAQSFQSVQPFPWANVQGFLTADGFQRLADSAPDVSLLTPEFRKARGHGQASHDRYALQYRPALDAQISPAWRAFIAELHGPDYQSFLRRLHGMDPGQRFTLTMHWHYAPRGGSVSPHTDASRKIGSHIFYFNTPSDWDPAWGGQTLVLDDAGHFPAHSAPDFGDFRTVAASAILGNQSFIFQRTPHSWHGVAPITAPEGKLRKVFIVVANRANLQVWWRRVRGKDADGYALR